MDRIKFILLILGVAALSTCDAPRNNPLDPFNPESGVALIEGEISSSVGKVENVNILWQYQGQSAVSNKNGYFKFNNVEHKNGWLRFSKPGYLPDSLYINWNDNKYKYIDQYLNSEPVMDSLELFSIVENRYIFGQNIKLLTNVKIIDADGNNEIDSVKLYNSFLDTALTLDYNISTKFHYGEFIAYDFGVSDLDQLIGREFSILVYDNYGHQFNVGHTFIKRIIKTEIETVSPAGGSEAQLPVKLKWNRFTPGFPFTYLAQIYTNSTEPQLIWQKPIESSEITFIVEKAIEPGEYYWVIWCVDEFLNRTRSKPSTFIIPN